MRSNAVAYLALFVALGGTSYAAVQLPKDSVGSKQIRKNAVTSSKVKNGSLGTADLSKSARAALKGDTGAAGAKGDKGDKGEKGDTGPATGPAGGDLAGDYPNPTIKDGAVTTSKLAGGPRVSLRSVTNQSIPNDAATDVQWATETYDVGDMHAGTSADVRAPIAGTYVASYSLNFSSNATGIRFASLYAPGETTATLSPHTERADAVATGTTILSGAATFHLDADDVIRLAALQDRGSALNLNTSYTSIEVTWVGP